MVNRGGIGRNREEPEAAKDDVAGEECRVGVSAGSSSDYADDGDEVEEAEREEISVVARRKLRGKP